MQVPPFWQLGLHLLYWQALPRYPDVHQQTSSWIHRPPCWQGDLHRALSHLLPEKPSGQIHTSGDIQVPLFSHAGSHMDFSQRGPRNPWAHSQKPYWPHRPPFKQSKLHKSDATMALHCFFSFSFMGDPLMGLPFLLKICNPSSNPAIPVSLPVQGIDIWKIFGPPGITPEDGMLRSGRYKRLSSMDCRSSNQYVNISGPASHVRLTVSTSGGMTGILSSTLGSSRYGATDPSLIMNTSNGYPKKLAICLSSIQSESLVRDLEMEEGRITIIKNMW